MVNKDSLITYNLYSGNVKYDTFINKCPVDIFLGAVFLDRTANNLYIYEVQPEVPNHPTAAALNLTTKEWTVVNYETLPIQLHHHSSAYDEKNDSHYIFGGFGDVYYSKELYKYDSAKNKFEVVKTIGSRIEPRYFSSMGYRKANHSLYIYGGMGNESGEQIVGRRYYYDLHKVDLTTNTVSKQWTIPWKKENVVPVREMVIQDDSCFYTLCYPEHFSNTFLKLYRFSFKDGSFEIQGDSIPIRSDKIKTKANIYFSDKLNKLIAIVQEFDDNDISSKINTYTLVFPPISSELLSTYTTLDHRQNQIELIAIIVGSIFIIILLIYTYRKYIQERQSKKDKQTIEPISGVSTFQRKKKVTKPSSVYLFGDFIVYDRHNKDITYMFSTKLKHIFLTIIQYTPNGGISSANLSELFWPGKPEDKVKNSRGVALNHIRSILKEINGVELIHDKGMFKIAYSDAFYCDYLECIRIISTYKTENDQTDLIAIVTRGKFLQSIDNQELDTFKGNLEQTLEPVLLTSIENSFRKESYTDVVSLCECLFDIDPINDEALCFAVQSLTRMNMTNVAKKLYLQFCVRYMNTMSTEYHYPFAYIQKRQPMI